MKFLSDLRLPHWIPSVGLRLALGFAALGATVVPAEASHFRYGHVTWQSTGPLSVTFTLQAAFRRNGFTCINGLGATIPCTGADTYPGVGDLFSEDIGKTALSPGDGSMIASFGGALTFVVTAIDPVNNWIFALGLDPASLPAVDTKIDHTYAAPGNYTASFASCCRTSTSDHINNPGGNYSVETIVDVGDDNNSPQSSLPPIVTCIAGEMCTFVVPGNDPDGDHLRFRLSTAAEAADGGSFVQPGPVSPSINPTTGIFQWDTAGATYRPSGLTLYSEQVTIEEATGPSKSAVDFFIQLQQCPAGSPPVFQTTCNGQLTVNAGSTLDVDIAANDPDSGDLVTMNAVGVPPGATLTPSLPTTGNPVTTHLSWTPSIADVGTNVVSFVATDNCGSNGGRQTLCTILVVASENCSNGLDDDGDGKIDCADEDCRFFPACTLCGDGIVNGTEQCDDGNTISGDCCASNCTNETAGGSCAADGNPCTDDVCDGAGRCGVYNTISCDDGLYCNGDDTCSAGACLHSGTPCPGGVCSSCDEATDTCSLALANAPCTTDNDKCTTDVCDGTGTCTHAPVPFSPVCYWTVVAGSSTQTGKVKTRPNSSITGSVCTDTGEVGQYSRLIGDEATSWSLLGTSGTAVKVRGGATLANGSMATGGGCVESLGTAPIFGTVLGPICCADGDVELPGGDPNHVINACGTNDLVSQCTTAKARIVDDTALLNGLAQTRNFGGALVVAAGKSVALLVDAGQNVIDLDKIAIKRGGTLTIDAQGNADAVVVLRLGHGMSLAPNASIHLAGGLLAQNLLFYGEAASISIGAGATGEGTLFCPSGSVRLRAVAAWNGAVAGGAKTEMGRDSKLTHAGFTGTLQ